MCLSIVGEITVLNGNCALVDIMGIQKKVSVELIENPQIGDKLLIHAGCAIGKLSNEDFLETVEAITQLEESECG